MAIEDFYMPNNSHKAKADAQQAEKQRMERPEASKVISGEAKIHTESKSHRLLRMFIAEDLPSVGNQLMEDYIVPGIKNFALEALGMVLGCDIRPRAGSRSGMQTGYGSYYVGRRDIPVRKIDRVEERRTESFDTLEFDNRADAIAVQDRMQDMLEMYGSVTVNDMYGFAGRTLGNYQAANYGWDRVSDIVNAQIRRIPGGGYLLLMPKPYDIR